MPRTVRDQFAEIPGILGRTSDLDGWHRPGENEAANRHDFAACLAEANAAAVDLLEPSFSDDNLPFGGDPRSILLLARA
jgi:hypothetical protein